MKEDKRLDNGVRQIWTTSSGFAQSMGRPSFIKWHEKEEYNHHLQKRVLYLHYGKWPKNAELCWRNGHHHWVRGVEKC